MIIGLSFRTIKFIGIILICIINIMQISCKDNQNGQVPYGKFNPAYQEDEEERLERLEAIRIQKEKEELRNKNIIHVRFFCGDSVFTFRNVHPSIIKRCYLMGEDLENDNIVDLEGLPIILYSIEYQGKIYKSRSIDIYFD